jgi:hypothetical protein
MVDTAIIANRFDARLLAWNNKAHVPGMTVGILQ